MEVTREHTMLGNREKEMKLKFQREEAKLKEMIA